MNRAIALGILLGALASGCGRETAEEAFAKAEAAEADVAKQMDTVKSPETARALYHPVIDAFGRVREDHPKHVLAEVSLFRIATIRNNMTHEVPEAIDAYKRYVELYPDGAQTPVAMFLIGYLYNNELHQVDSAGVAYRRFLDKYPNHEMALSAQFELNTLGKSPEEFIGKH